jgi:hypothetical protein
MKNPEIIFAVGVLAILTCVWLFIALFTLSADQKAWNEQMTVLEIETLKRPITRHNYDILDYKFDKLSKMKGKDKCRYQEVWVAFETRFKSVSPNYER